MKFFSIAGIRQSLTWIDVIVAPVWLILTLLMVLAIVLLSGPEEPYWNGPRRWVFGLIALVYLYPLYSFGFQLVPGLIGNLVVLGYTLSVIAIAYPRSPWAAALLTPTVIWLLLATFYVIVQRLDG